jgi:hypothetical protein
VENHHLPVHAPGVLIGSLDQTHVTHALEQVVLIVVPDEREAKGFSSC